MQDVSVGSYGNSYRGVAYLCSSCRAVLSVAIDPVALKADTVREVLAALRKH